MTDWRDDLKIESAGRADRDDQRDSDIYTKDMPFRQFVAEWTEAVECTQFPTFRWDLPTLGGYVINHAYDLWSAHYDLWDTVAAFALNYANRVQRDTEDNAHRLEKWIEHGKLVRDLIIGS